PYPQHENRECRRKRMGCCRPWQAETLETLHHPVPRIAPEPVLALRRARKQCEVRGCRTQHAKKYAADGSEERSTQWFGQITTAPRLYLPAQGTGRHLPE